MKDISNIIMELEEADETELMEFDFRECFKYLREHQQLLAWQAKVLAAYPNIDLNIAAMDT